MSLCINQHTKQVPVRASSARYHHVCVPYLEKSDFSKLHCSINTLSSDISGIPWLNPIPHASIPIHRSANWSAHLIFYFIFMFRLWHFYIHELIHFFFVFYASLMLFWRTVCFALAISSQFMPDFYFLGH